MELNSLNNFGRDSCKEHPFKISTNLKVLRKEKLFKEIVDARTLELADDRTMDNRPSQMLTFSVLR